MIPVITAFLLTVLLIELWMRVAKKFNHISKDVHKPGEQYVPESGGIPVMYAYYTSILLLSFFYPSLFPLTLLVIASTALAGMVGVVDDMMKWRGALGQLLKPLFTLFGAIPLSILTFYSTHLNPFPVPDYIYAFLLVPIGFVGASNAINILGGFNGLEAGLSTVILFFLSLKAFFDGYYAISLLGMIAVIVLAVYFMYNKYPARLFGGNSLPYFTGSLIAVIAILSNNEVMGALLLLPFFLDLFIKIMKGFRGDNFGRIRDGGILENRHGEVYSLTHVVMKLNVTEAQLTTVFLVVEFILGSILLWWLL